mmetsp:Transcript_7295/g.11569  ORF Transcript_7295/g.11569 Transcript_7295/m.11569 type:complete len:207 (+) Transcript_7295:439-1059(+)
MRFSFRSQTWISCTTAAPEGPPLDVHWVEILTRRNWLSADRHKDVIDSVSIMESSESSTKLYRRIFFSEHVATIRVPSLLTAKSFTRAPVHFFKSAPLMSQRKMHLSRPPETNRRPSGNQAHAVTWSVCRENVRIHVPNFTSHSFTSLSLLQVKRWVSSGLHAKKERESPWLRRTWSGFTSCSVTSHMITVLSFEAEAKYAPLWEN